MSSSRYASMVVLPQAEYLELQQRHQQSASPLEQKHDKVLHQYREHFNIHDPIEQQYKQGEDLNELRRLREKMNTYYFKDEDQQRGSALLFTLSPALLDYNHAGEIVDKHSNHTVRGSRIDDLIKYAVTQHPSVPEPIGWKEFVSILKRVPHIPPHILNSQTLDQLSSSPPTPLSPVHPPPTPLIPVHSPPASSTVSSPPAPKQRKRKLDTPAHLHYPRTRFKAKRSQDAHEAAESLIGKFRKF